MRKKFLLMIFVLSLFTSMGGGWLHAQTKNGVLSTNAETITLFEDDFTRLDEEFWTQIDHDGDGKKWYYENGHIISKSFYDGVGAFDPEDCIVTTSSYTLSESSELTLKIGPNSSSYNDNAYKVVISEDMTNWIAVHEENFRNPDNYTSTQTRSISLSEHSGETVHVGVLHFYGDQYAGSGIKIDYIKLTGAAPAAEPVAKIGTTKYASLQTALNDAAAGTGNVTVEILDNINLTGIDWNPVTVSAPGYPVVTVEGNNNTITGLNDMLFAATWAGNSGLIIKNLTIENSTIENDKNDAAGNVGVGAFVGYPQASAIITLENCHLKNSSVEGGHWTGGLIGMAGGYNGADGPVFMNLTIKGCSVTGSTITGKGSVGGVIGHGSCSAWTNVVIEETTVSGNTITSTGSSDNKAGAVMGTIGAAGQATTVNGVEKQGGALVAATVSGNTVKSNGTAITTIYGRQGTSTGVLELNGGSYDNYPIEEGVAYAAPAEGYKIVMNANNTYGIEEDPAYGKVAKIGETTYKSLIEAAAAVQDGETITLIADEIFTATNYTDNGGWRDGLGYAGDKSFTIDLNGFTVSQDGSLNDYLFWFKNAGLKANTITIKNGTLDAGKTAYCALCTASSHDNQLTINTEDLNLINNISNGSTVKVRAGSVLNVKEGTKITGKNSYLGIENWNATVNIYDGAEIYMNGTSSYNGCLVGVGGNGTVNVYGGYGKGVKGGFIAMTSGGTINVAGGEWIANTDGTVGNNSNLYVLTAQSNKYESGFAGPSIINVTGGTLRGGMDAWVLNNHKDEKAELNISGGNFNANPASYVEAGYVATEAAGIYTVVEAPAYIDGKASYASLAAAYEAAVNGDVIVLNESVTTFPVINKAVTFKGGKENAAVEINYALSQNFTAIDGIVRFENLTFNKPLFTEHGGNKPGLSIEFEGCNFNVNSEAGYGILIGTSWSNSVVKGLKVNNCNFKYVGTEFKGGYMLYVQCVNEVTITNNTIDGNNLYRGAIHLGDATEHATVATVSNNTIKNFCRGVMMGNRVAGSFATISGNTFDNINYSDKDSKPAQECAPIFIHSNATAAALQVALTDNKVENCANPMIYSEDTDLIKYYVTEFTGNTVGGSAVEFANSYNAPNQIFPVATINDAEYFTLQAAINAVQNGETIVLTKDCAEVVSINKSNVAFTINGKISDTENIAYTGKIQINVGQNVTVKNINFSHAGDEAHDFIANVGSPTGRNYNTTLLVEGCSFVGGNNNYNTVAVRTIHPTHTQIKNSTGTRLHSFLQNTGGQQVTVEGVVLTDSKGGLAIGSPNGAVSVKDCDLTTNTYGVRLDANNTNAPGTTLENNKVNAYIPVSVRKATAPNYNLTFNGEENAYVATNGDNVWCAVCTTEYEEGVALNAPTGKVRVALNDTGLSMDGVYGNYYELAGEGTAENPYLINSVYDLKYFRDKVDEQAQDGSTQFAGKYFKLTADLDLAGINWNPIGSMSGDHGSFKGVFDGGNHTISNLNCEQAGNGLGLFARTAGNAEIKNLKLNNVTVKSTDNSNYVGGVVGNAYASTKINNVHVSGTINIAGRGYIGGIAGHGYVVMDNVSVVANEGLITSTLWCAGGILGYAGEGSTNIMNANVEGITITSAAGGLGAIVGMAEDNEGTQPISGSNLSAKNVEIKTYVGAYGTYYEDYAIGYLYGGNPTSKLTGELNVENVTLTNASGKTPAEVSDAVANVDGKIYFAFSNNEFKLLENGNNVTILRAGKYSIPTGKDLTITGAVNGVVFENIGAYGMGGANVTFNNVTFNYAENSTYKGLQHSGNLVYNNCTINGQVFLYGESETFNGCTFNTTDSNNYNVWTYGAKEVAFNGCTFYCAGKSVLIYNESPSVNNNVAVTNSQFIASQAVEGKAAIEMDSSLQGTINLTIDGETTATGFAAGNVSGNSLWNNKKANNDITVVVNNETVLAPINGDGTEDNPYLINNVRELVAFRESVNAGKTEFNAPGVYVALNADIDLAGTTWEHGIGDGINATFDGIFDGRNNTIKNFTMEVSAPAGDYVCGGLFGYINGAATIKNLVIENVTITATVNGEGQGHNVGVLVGFANNNGGKATIDNVTVKGDVKVDASNVYGVGTIVGYSYRDMGTISNCTVDADAGSYIKGYSFVGGITGYSYSNAVISNCSVENLAITATSKGVGGIAGLALEGNNISGCTVANTTTVNGETNVAYIIGELGNSNGNVIIENCTAPQPWVGGAYATGEPFVATIGTKYYTSIKDAIKAVKDNETIVLIRDITMDYNARDSYETQTQNIVIDGNDHTLTLNQKNSDWASIGLANNSKLVLNNMTIEKTGYGDTNGAWNTHAIIFSCPLEMNDVIVNNSMAVQAGAILNNVAINEDNGYYGLWINGNGQSVTMNGGSITATNGGRGIKIADQYIDAPAQVTLNVTGTYFNTAKKAAVLVSSKEGAQIVASNVNIENVAEDTVNFVWVDEDWAANFGNVEVTGAKVAQEGIEKFVAAVKKDAKVEGYYASLQAAVNAVQNGESVTLTLINDVAENVTVSQNNGINIVIDGQNHNFSGTITIDGNSRTTGESLTIQNVNFVTNVASLYFIDANSTANTDRYPHNVTVKDCTFTAEKNSAAVNTAVAMRFRQGFNIAVENVTAVRLHSLMQNYGVAGLTVENVTVEGKNGIALGTSTNVTVNNANIVAAGYGLRVDASVETPITIADSEIEAFIPVVVRTATANTNITFNGDNDMRANNGNSVWCVIGKDEYKEGVELEDIEAATGKVIVNLSESNLSYEGVYGNYAVAKIGKVQYASLQAAIEDAQNGDTVILFANTDEVVSVNVLNKEISIVGEEDLFPVLTGGLDFGIDNHSQDAGNITIKGIKFVGNGIKIDDMASVTIEGNIFENITASNAIYVAADEYTTTLAITNNIITNVAGAGINLRNPINATVTGNTITNVTGNAMTFQNNGAIEDVAGEIVITGNVLTDWAYGKTEGRAIRLALGNITDNVIIEENAMIAANAPEEFVKISGTSNAEISVDENYWNGVAPTAQHFLADGVQIHNYYASYNVETNTLSNLVTLAGETLEIFYTAAGVETTKEQAVYSLSFAVTDYVKKEASVKIGKKPTKQATLNLPTKVEFNGIEYTITLIPANAFHTCYHFVGDLVIPATVKRIENGAFQQCFADSGEKLGTLTLNENLTYIGNAAFLSSRFKGDLVVPSSVEYVGNYAFNNSGMDGTLTINRNVTNRDGFNGSKFTKLVVSEGVTSVGFYRAFAGMKSLKEVTLPSTLKEIGNEAFYEATAINKVYSSAFEAPAINNNNAFDNVVKDNATLCVEYYKNYQNGEWAEFANVYSEFVIQKEGYSLLVKVNDDNCSVQIKDTPKDSEKRKLEIPAEFDYFGTTKEITSIAANGFKSCNFYGEVVVPGTIKTVGNNAFNSCYKINRIVFENGVESIGRSTLGNMYALTYVEFPASLKTIGNNCFTGYGENHKIITIVSYATEVPVAEAASSFQQYVADKATLYVFEDVVSKYKNATGWSRFKTIKPIEAKIGETVYYSLAKAIEASKAGDVITLIADVEAADANPVVIPTGVTLDINTHDITANIYGTVMTAGGVWTTVAVPGFNSRRMLGDGAIYNTTNATVVNLANEVNVLAGTIVLNPHPKKEWWTLPGQSLSIATGATFEIPVGVKFTVREGNANVNGTLINNGTLAINAGATVTGNLTGDIHFLGGNFITADGYQMVGTTEEYYYNATNALVNIESTFGDITILSGAMTLGQSWRTVQGQTLTVAEGASFTVPTGMTFEVFANTHVVVEGTLVTDGTVYLQAGATVRAEAGLNIQTTVAGHVVKYNNGVYSVVEQTIFTQTIQLNAGWNWFSSYVETDLESLQNALGENGVMIKNHHHGYTENEDGEWWGALDTFDSEQMYLIKINEDQQLIIKGEMINPSEHPISIKQGWNAIAYMLNTSMSLKDALASINPIEGDYIKGRTGYAEFDGEEWFGDLSTMIPGEGYMFKNSSDEVRTLTYSYPTRGTNTEAKANVTTDGNHWTPNAAQFANNMTMTAVLDVENINYEVAAFVNGECRGSARPIYVEALDAYMLFLTIHGEEVEEMTFKYYDIDTDIEYTLSDRINYSNNAILGSLKEPYMFTRGTTGIGEAELSQLNIYPNPTTTAAEINLNATFDKVEVFNALGVKVAEYSNVDSIDALETAGIYVIRATNNSVISHCRLVVK